MRALRWVYVIALQAFLYDDSGSADMWPLYGNAQPGVAASPASRTNEHVVRAFVEKTLVDALDVRGDGRIVGCGIVLSKRVTVSRVLVG